MVTRYSDRFLDTADMKKLLSAYGTVLTESNRHPSEATEKELDRITGRIRDIPPKFRQEGYGILSDMIKEQAPFDPRKAQDLEQARNHYRARFMK